jgi:hypothetical protein
MLRALFAQIHVSSSTMDMPTDAGTADEGGNTSIALGSAEGNTGEN